MPRILVVADEVDDALFGPAVRSIDAELVLSCGDLPFEYLEFIVSMTDVPLLYVPGNHDPDLRGRERIEGWPPPAPKLADADPPGPLGCINVDGRIEDTRGLRIAGLGGSVRYREGPNQYSQREMRARARRLRRQSRRRRLRDGRGIDVAPGHRFRGGRPRRQGAPQAGRAARAPSREGTSCLAPGPWPSLSGRTRCRCRCS